VAALKRLAGVAALSLALVAPACMGESESPARLRVLTPTPEPAAMISPTPAAVEEPTPTPEPTPDPESTPTPDDDPSPSNDLDAAMAAAAAALGIDAGDACSDGEDCIRELPGGGTRTDGSIARLAYVAGAGGGAIAIVARDTAGTWQYWLLTAGETYQLFDVPGDLRICSDASTLTVRQAPDPGAAAAGELGHGEVVHAGSFALTEPGSLESHGAGWYRVDGAVSGWVSSRESSDAALGDCTLRNQIEGEPGTVG
jgi:hypothetical protein